MSSEEDSPHPTRSDVSDDVMLSKRDEVMMGEATAAIVVYVSK